MTKNPCRRRFGTICVTCFSLLFTWACAGRIGVEPPAPSGDVATVVFIVGDAGDVNSSPVLAQLTQEVQSASDTEQEVVVAFLGDNIYTHGLRPDTHPGYQDDTLRLNAQMRVVESRDARAIFVPGNHDWDYSGRIGYTAIRR